MSGKKRICSVCRNEYDYCPKCKKDENKPYWYFTFCSEDCKDIYSVLSEYKNKNISFEEAHEFLKDLDLSRFENFGESYKCDINEINSLVSQLRNDDEYNCAEEIVELSDAVEYIEQDKQIEEKSEDFKEEIVLKKPKKVYRDVE
jgi:hypothetical protein